LYKQKQTQFGRAKCAKQTQLPEAGHRGGVEESAGRQNTQHSTILSFHHVSPVPRVPNEPNFGEQIGRGRGPIMRNKPNLGKSNGRIQELAEQTNPICGGAGWDKATGTMCETKPIPAAPGWARPQGRASGADCAKRSQFRAVPNGPGLGDEGRGGQSCQTNPIRLRGLFVGVKQGQFREGRTDAQVPCGKVIMMVLTRRWAQENKANSQAGSEGRVCQTKPIPGAGLSPAGGRLVLGRDGYNGRESVFRFSALISGGWVHIYTNADADISTPVK